MLQVFSKDTSEIILDSKNPQKNIDIINSHIELCNCKYMTVDISRLNIMDACMVSTLCSTTHYMKYPDGEINWVVNSSDIKNYTSAMSLGNTKFHIK